MRARFTIKADDLPYRELNERIRQSVKEGAKEILVQGVCGQRYIGAALAGDVEITLEGVPGNDLACFLDGPRIIVKGNAQEGVGNTMNRGEVIVHGDAGDILGYAMRGGRIFVKGDVGYRVGIHMKAYKDFFPVIIVGGGARDFLGEYMAGGLLVVLNLKGGKAAGDFIAPGMHGGTLLLRGEIDHRTLAKEVKIGELTPEEEDLLKRHLIDFCTHFGFDLRDILQVPFTKIYPYTHRPYGTIYAY